MARQNGGGRSRAGPSSSRKVFSYSSAGPSKAPRHANGRKDRKSRSDDTEDVSNAYSFEPSLPKHHRTSDAQLSLSREEAYEARPRRVPKGEEEDGDDEMEERVARLAAQIAGDEGLEEVEEDEEVDSDEAWEEGGSDDERWGEVFRDLQKGKAKGKAKKEVVKKAAKPLTVNLAESEEDLPAAPAKSKRKLAVKFEEPDDDSEDDEDENQDEDSDAEEDGEDDDNVEMDSEDEEADSEEDEFGHHSSSKSMRTNGKAPLKFDDEEDAQDSADEAAESGEDESEDEEEDGAGSDAPLPSDLSDEEDDPEALADLDAFIDGLASADANRKKRRPVADDDAVDGAPGKKRRVVLPAMPGPAIQDGMDVPLRSSKSLDIATLISSHPSLASAASLLKSSLPSASSSSILKSGVLPAPLPTVVQDRLDREAAYTKTKEEGHKWQAVMKRIKEAEHLSFPLQSTDRGGVKSGGEMLANFHPTNEMESAVTALLSKANMTEKEMTKAEDEALQGQELSLEEIAARRAQLRYQRELLFRAESRAKRVAKIKSKTFRKLARKRAERDGAQLGLEELDRLDPEAAEAEREKVERQRAIERATLKHSARGKFGQDGKGQTTFGLEERRRAREDMLDRKEQLARKIAGGAGDDDSDSEEEEESEDEEIIKARAFDQLASLDQPTSSTGQGAKGLMGMKFMKNAEEKKMRKVREAEAAARDEIRLFGDPNFGNGDPASDASDADGGGGSDEEEGEVLKIGEGRMVFGGPSKSASAAPNVPTPLRNTATSQAAAIAEDEDFNSPASTAPATTAVNPWLVPSSTAGPSRKKNKSSITAESKSTKATKSAMSRDTARARAEEDERVDIDLHAGAVERQASKRANDKVAAKSSGLAEDGDDSEDEEELLPVTRKGITAFQQRELVAEAFAGDNVVEDFALEKARQTTADAPKTQDTTLPGWGSWGGKGVTKRAPQPRNIVTKPGIPQTSRKDFGLDTVIINERNDAKAQQWLAKDLPYPYTSVAQYEASFNTPVGAEWNSRMVHQRQTLPRVIKKKGAIIEPVRRLF